MGKLIKADLARLIILAAATYHVAASIQGFFWPKIFWDFLTKKLDRAVKPFPFLAIINLAFSLPVLAYEWPLKLLAGTVLHRSIKAKLFALPFPIFAASLMYQATDPAIYYMIGSLMYLWAIRSGETVLVERTGHFPKRQVQNPFWPGHRLRNAAPEIPLQSQPPTQIRRAMSMESKQYLPPHAHDDLTPFFDPTFQMMWEPDLLHDVVPEAGPSSGDIRRGGRMARQECTVGRRAYSGSARAV